MTVLEVRKITTNSRSQERKEKKKRKKGNFGSEPSCSVVERWSVLDSAARQRVGGRGLFIVSKGQCEVRCRVTASGTEYSAQRKEVLSCTTVLCAASGRK